MKKAAALTAVLAVLALAGCPQPVDDQLLRVVEDAIPPDIALTSPAANGEIRSTVTIAGRITDSSFRANDKGGVLDSVEIQVQAEPQLTRAIKLADGSFTVTPADPTFTFDFDSGAFSIELDTSSIDRSREFIISATDRNGNSAEVRRLLFPSDGMLIQMQEPGTAFTMFEVGGLFTIAGTVTNSSSDLNNISELASLKWEIVQNPAWSAVLDTTPGGPDDQGATYERQIIGPFPDVMPPFVLTRADGSFTSSFTIPPSGVTTLTVKVTATDRNGIARSAERTVTEDLEYPTFILMPPNPRYGSPLTSYYSSSPPSEVVTVQGLVDDVLLIQQLKYDLSSPVGAPVSVTYSGAGLASVMNPVTGDLTFTVDTAGRQGNIILTITARSPEGLEAPFPITIRDDRTAPSIAGVSISSTNVQSGGPYARIGDTVNVGFTLSDAQTGINPASVAASIGGGAASVTNLGGGAWRASRVLAGGEPQAMTLTIAAADMIGNAANASATSDGSSVTFYQGPPTVSGLAMTSSNASPTWAKASDVVTLSFAATRELASAPTVADRGPAGSRLVGEAELHSDNHDGGDRPGGAHLLLHRPHGRGGQHDDHHADSGRHLRQHAGTGACGAGPGCGQRLRRVERRRHYQLRLLADPWVQWRKRGDHPCAPGRHAGSHHAGEPVCGRGNMERHHQRRRCGRRQPRRAGLRRRRGGQRVGRLGSAPDRKPRHHASCGARVAGPGCGRRLGQLEHRQHHQRRLLADRRQPRHRHFHSPRPPRRRAGGHRVGGPGSCRLLERARRRQLRGPGRPQRPGDRHRRRGQPVGRRIAHSHPRHAARRPLDPEPGCGQRLGGLRYRQHHQRHDPDLHGHGGDRLDSGDPRRGRVAGQRRSRRQRQLQRRRQHER